MKNAHSLVKASKRPGVRVLCVMTHDLTLDAGHRR